MIINKKNISAHGIKLFVEENGEEVARAYLYILKNDLHDKPFGFMEDVFVNENQRGKGLGTEIVQKLMEEAKNQGCYKLIANSRHENIKVHSLYEKLGFKNHGLELRIDY